MWKDELLSRGLVTHLTDPISTPTGRGRMLNWVSWAWPLYSENTLVLGSAWFFIVIAKQPVPDCPHEEMRAEKGWVLDRHFLNCLPCLGWGQCGWGRGWGPRDPLLEPQGPRIFSCIQPTIYLADMDWAPAVCWTWREKFFERRMKTFQIEVIELLGILMLEGDIEGL